jgi:hypothetical protein
MAVLERENRILSAYDIVRGASRDFSREISRPSLAVTLSNDLRFCWAGRGLYGLFRNRLVPGPRNLQGVGSLFVFAIAGPLTLQQLAFAMRWCGYRFADFSLLNALREHAPVVIRLRGEDRSDARAWTIAVLEKSELRRHVEAQGFAPNAASLEKMILRCKTFLATAETERQRRLGGEVEAPSMATKANIKKSAHYETPNYAPSGDLTHSNYNATLAAARADGRPWLDGSHKPITHILRRRGETWLSKQERDELIRRAHEVIFGRGDASLKERG